MPSSGERSRLDFLLHDLYLKKQWLDTIIAGLETATHSADHKFLESITKALGDARVRRPSVDLEERERAKLARLAQQVRRTVRRRLISPSAG